MSDVAIRGPMARTVALIAIHTDDGQLNCAIHVDGTFECGPAYNFDEAAERLFLAVAQKVDSRA
jgi:hypothetical protein